MKRKTKGWSQERRALQAENIRKTKPWTRACGPKTPEGKAITAQNALKTGLYSAEIKTLRQFLKQQAHMLKNLNNEI